MSSLPSLSQSKRPTPPLMDSSTYLLSGEEICGTVRPLCRATSSNAGPLYAGGLVCARKKNEQKKTGMETQKGAENFRRIRRESQHGYLIPLLAEEASVDGQGNGDAGV